MDKLTNIVLEYLEKKSLKHKAIRTQDYQLAAISRDSEREIARKLYNQLNSIKNEDFIDWNTYEKFVKDWIYSEYGINDYTDKEHNIKLINRKNNIDKLNI